MARARALPDLKTRFVVDYSQLTKTEKAIAASQGQLLKGFDKSRGAAGALESRLGSLGGVLGRLGPLGQQAGSVLTDIGGTAGALGTSLGLVGGVAIAAGVGLAAGAAYAEHAYETLTAQVDQYQDVTGASAEQASRMAHVANVLGVNVDQLSGSMFKLSRAVADNPQKLEALGVEIQKDAAGSVDLTETLYAVSDAYVNAGDASTRTKILFAAFGRSGADMIDVVEQGSVRLRQLAADAKLVLTDDDIRRAREYAIHQKELKSGWDEWWATLGQKVQPALDAVQTSILRGQFVQDKLNQAVKDGIITQEQAAGVDQSAADQVAKLTTKYEGEYDELQKVKFAMDLHTQTIREQTEDNQRLVDLMNKVIGGLETEASTANALQRAQIALGNTTQRVKDSHDLYSQAVKQYGKNSPEALQALRDYRSALLDQEDAYRAAAKAAGDHQTAVDNAATGQGNARETALAYIGQLEAEAKTLAPNSPLRKELTAYIKQLREDLPAEITTKVSINYDDYSVGAHFRTPAELAAGRRRIAGPPLVPKKHAAFGAHFSADEPGVIGEFGPEIFIPDQPGTVVPNGQRPAAAAPSEDRGDIGGGDVTIHEGDTSIAIFQQTVQDARQTAGEVGWQVQQLRRAR